MQPDPRKIRLLSLIVLILTLQMLTGCYYMQATRGHLELMSKRESIDSLLEDPTTNSSLRERLALLSEARDFSIHDLGLPDNQSYRSYAALERDYVLWNIFAAPEDDLAAKQWCYPIVGCLAYRGYFKEEVAREKAKKLEKDGYDVAVGGVPAYSTLGRFDDPVLDTMMRWDNLRLVGTLFHELAHQVVYIPDDTRFNESFATAVEEIGLERWLASRGESELLSSYRKRKSVGKAVMQLVEQARTDLEVLYSARPSDMHERKKERFRTLSADVESLLASNGMAGNHWLTGENVNNAHLVPLALYEGLVPAFRQIFLVCEEGFECFYAEVTRLGELPAEARSKALEELSASAPAASSIDRRAAPPGTELPGPMRAH